MSARGFVERMGSYMAKLKMMSDARRGRLVYDETDGLKYVSRLWGVVVEMTMDDVRLHTSNGAVRRMSYEEFVKWLAEMKQRQDALVRRVSDVVAALYES